jgi:hypothetical protein
MLSTTTQREASFKNLNFTIITSRFLTKIVHTFLDSARRLTETERYENRCHSGLFLDSKPLPPEYRYIRTSRVAVVCDGQLDVSGCRTVSHILQIKKTVRLRWVYIHLVTSQLTTGFSKGTVLHRKQPSAASTMQVADCKKYHNIFIFSKRINEFNDSRTLTFNMLNRSAI